MAYVQPPQQESDDIEVDPEVSRLVEADARSALLFLCARADDFPGGREVSRCLARRRRQAAASWTSARRRAG